MLISFIKKPTWFLHYLWGGMILGWMITSAPTFVNFLQGEQQALYFLAGKSAVTFSLTLALVFFICYWQKEFAQQEQELLIWWLPLLMIGGFWLILLLLPAVYLTVTAVLSASTNIWGVKASQLWQGAFSVLPIIATLLAGVPLFFKSVVRERQETARQQPSASQKKPEKPTDTGGKYEVVDRYVQTNTFHKGKVPKVILAEDDMLHATFLLDLFENTELPCLHVATADAAFQALDRFENDIKILITDNFLRGGGEQKLHTGMDLLKAIAEKYPNRQFKLVLMSGMEMSRQAGEYADLILEKPINMRKLYQDLYVWGVI